MRNNFGILKYYAHTGVLTAISHKIMDEIFFINNMQLLCGLSDNGKIKNITFTACSVRVDNITSANEASFSMFFTNESHVSLVLNYKNIFYSIDMQIDNEIFNNLDKVVRCLHGLRLLNQHCSTMDPTPLLRNLFDSVATHAEKILVTTATRQHIILHIPEFIESLTFQFITELQRLGPVSDEHIFAARTKQRNLFELFQNVSNIPDNEVPENYCCPLTKQIMTDPVIVNGSGITYERRAITKWINHNGGRAEEPMTRRTITLSDLTPNRALMEDITRFLESKTTSQKLGATMGLESVANQPK